MASGSQVTQFKYSRYCHWELDLLCAPPSILKLIRSQACRIVGSTPEINFMIRLFKNGIIWFRWSDFRITEGTHVFVKMTTWQGCFGETL